MTYNFNWNIIRAGRPKITLSKQSVMFNGAVISILGNPERIIIGYDCEKCIIGLKDYGGEQGVPTFSMKTKRRISQSGWAKIGCQKFAATIERTTGIRLNHARTFRAEYDKKNKVVFAKIEK